MPNDLNVLSSEQESATLAAAQAELAQARGGTIPKAADAVASDESASAGESQEAEPGAEQSEEDDGKSLPEEPEAEEAEQKAEEPKPAKSEEEIRKEAERQAKKKYLSKINLQAKELEELRKARAGVENADDIEKVVKATLAERDYSDMEKAEKKQTFSTVPDFKKFEGEISQYKDAHPDLSWKQAANLWAADHRPDLLVKPKQKSSMTGSAPTYKGDESSGKSLEQLAREEFQSTSSFFRR